MPVSSTWGRADLSLCPHFVPFPPTHLALAMLDSLEVQTCLCLRALALAALCLEHSLCPRQLHV